MNSSINIYGLTLYLMGVFFEKKDRSAFMGRNCLFFMMLIDDKFC